MAENKSQAEPKAATAAADTRPAVATTAAATPHAAVKDVRTEAEKKSDAEYKTMRDAQEKMNNEVMASQAKMKPTPTPEEMHKALEGHNVDNKEDHGAPEQNVHHVPVSLSKQIEVGNKDAARETKKDA